MWYALLIILGVSIYWYLKNKYNYWEKLGVKSRKVSLLFGNCREALTLKQSLGQIYCSLYKEFKNVAYVGAYRMRTPVLVIRDLEVAKDILIKDFDSFQNNDIHVDEEADPLFAKNPFALHGEMWKKTRSQITPLFSSGKMKLMFPYMINTTKKMRNFISTEGKNSCLNGKELCSKFTIDNVATCGFGLEAKSFENTETDFSVKGKMIFDPTFFMGVKLMILFIFPILGKIFKMRFFPLDTANYFREIVKKTLKYRRENKIVRNDLLDSMSKYKETLGDEFTNEDIAAHSIGFFADGYETSSISLSFLLYCMAANPEIQKKVRAEIKTVLAKHDGEFIYEDMQDMPYLDMAMQESMRLFPVIQYMARLCTKDYVLPPPVEGAKKVKIPIGMTVIIPVYAIHHDTKNFPNPEKFDPERFSDENKSSIAKCSFLPFGDGPRGCLGQRFGVMQVKVGIISILNDFEVTVNKKTQEPIQLDSKAFMTYPVGGLWIDFKKL